MVEEHSKRVGSPITVLALFLRVIGVIFVVEFFVMFGLWYLDVPDGALEFLADSVALSVLSAPFLYLWIIRLVAKRLRKEAEVAQEALERELSAKAYAEQMAVKAYADNIVKTIPSALVSLTRELEVRSVNPSFRRMFLEDNLEPAGKSMDEVLPFAGLVKESINEVLFAGVPKKDLVFDSNIRGKDRFFNISITEVAASEGKREILLVIDDITERKKSEDTISHMAQHDFLTGLPNRALFIDRITQVLPRMMRERLMAAVLYLDLDRFKFINDTLGHDAGDELLKVVSERLKECVRPSDTVARFGGDEFAVLMSDVERLEDVVKVTRRIFAAFDTPIELVDEEFNVTTSLGVSIFPHDGDDPDTLIKNADTAMYKAKTEGRNNSQFYDPSMNAKGKEWLKVVTKLRKAIDKKEFVLYYQPQVRVPTGELIGMEALIRWQEPETGLLLPGSFIPIAEDTGLITPIEEWAIATACSRCREWRGRGLEPVKIAINISMQHFRRPDFVDYLSACLEKSGCVRCRNLEIELTESIVMENPEDAVKKLERLKEMGLGLAIDDFGTGYSSLAYLKTMPIDRLKIAQSFVRDITVDHNDAAIAGAIIGLGKSLKIDVIAEGVETMQQLRMLNDLQCVDIQGFIVSKPVPPEDVEGFLEKGWRFSLSGPGESSFNEEGVFPARGPKG